MLVSDIVACCKSLRLSRNIVEMSDKIQADSHQEYLLKLLQSEIMHREKARKEKLLKKAGFYTIKTFESFKFDEVTLPGGITPEYLRECEFITNKNNIVMYGNVGTGKTATSKRFCLDLVKEGRALVEYCAGELDAVSQGLEELRLDELVARLEAQGTPSPADEETPR